MTIEKIREYYGKSPFEPFVIHLADGRELPVMHREFMALSPTGRTVIVIKPDDSSHIVDLLLVTDLHVLPPPKPGKPSRKNGKH